MNFIEGPSDAQPNQGTIKATRTVLIEPAITCLSPSNPAGLDSLIRSAYGEVGYSSLNEELLLGWALTRNVLAETVETYQNQENFQRSLQGFGLTRERVEEVIDTAELSREAFRHLDTYTDFETFMHHKQTLIDAVRILSAPFIGEKEREEVIIHHNTIDYYNSLWGDTRKGLVRLAGSAGLFKNYLQRDALPQVLEGDPSFVVVSVTHPDQHVFAFQLAHHIRQASPETVIIFGGNTISRRIDRWSRNDETGQSIFRRGRDERGGFVDGLIISEGELDIAELTLRMGKDPNIDLARLFSDIPGLIYNRDGRIVFNEFLPQPFYPEDLWKRDPYPYLKSGLMPDGRKVHSLVDGRICVFECQTGGCAFCHISKGYLEKMAEAAARLGIVQEPIDRDRIATAKTVRFAPPSRREIGRRGVKIIVQRRLEAELVAKEFAKGLEVGFSVVDITDEQFTLDQGLEYAKELERFGLNTGEIPDVVYSSYMRIDATGDPTNYREKYGRPHAEMLIDPQIAARLARGGMRFAQFGLETTASWKMVAMEKGTTPHKVKSFGTILRNFAQNDIMPHVFLIVGAPLDKNFWKDRRKVALEDRVLERPATANDLEILEAIYNLDFLQKHKDFIFTMKHTQYKLAFGSPQEEDPQASGLLVREESRDRRDASANISFAYQKGYGPTDQVLKDLLALYDLWKQEELPYQPVTQEYFYHQRIMQGMGAAKIREIAARLFPLGENRLSEEEHVDKRARLHRLWIQLVGGDKGMRLIADARKQPGNKKLQDRVNANLFVREFPDGFGDWSDLYRVAGLIDDIKGM